MRGEELGRDAVSGAATLLSEIRLDRGVDFDLAARKHDAGKASSTSRREVGAALPEPERATPPTAPAGDTPSGAGAAGEEGTANSEEEGAAAAAAAPAKTRRGGTGARKKVRARAKKAGKR